MKRMEMNSRFVYGWFGFFGFWGFSYYYTWHPASLSLFSLYGLFGWFFLQKAQFEKHDERFYENSGKAKSKALICAVVILCLLAGFMVFGFGTIELYVVLCALGIASMFIVYSAAFYYYDRC